MAALLAQIKYLDYNVISYATWRGERGEFSYNIEKPSARLNPQGFDAVSLPQSSMTGLTNSDSI